MDDLLQYRWRKVAADGTLELPEEVLKEIRLRGRYDEVTLDPAGGHVVGRLRVEGTYDSYSDTYVLNERVWKVETRVSLAGGGTVYRLVCVSEEG